MLKLHRGGSAPIALLSYAAAITFCIVLGFFLTKDVTTIFDSFEHYDRSRWIIDKYRHLFFGTPDVEISNQLKWYAPLWEIVLGLFSQVVFLDQLDPMWVRSAINASFFPMALLGVFVCVRRIGYSIPSAFLAAAMLLGMIRLGGHSLFNTTDFPLALSTLLVALATFLIVRNRGFTFRSLIWLGVLGVVPYLIRSPQIAPLVAMLLMGLFFSIFCERRKGLWIRVRPVFIPLVTALVLIYCLWPAVWEKPSYKGWHAWLQSFGGFMWFWWRGDLIVFGQKLSADRLPFWFSLAWLPVGLNPLAFLLLLSAPMIAWRTRKQTTSEIPRPIEFSIIHTPLKLRLPLLKITAVQWLLLFSTMGFAGVFILKPVLYDEDRHLLFLYPPLVIAAALSLSRLPSKIIVTLGLTITLSSLATYIQWGNLSYIYKSPIIINRDVDQFMGDYWGACLTDAARALAPQVVQGTKFLIPGSSGPRRNIEHAIRRSAPDRGLTVIEPSGPTTPPAIQLLFNRNNGIPGLTGSLNAQGAKLVREWRDPLGHLTCAAFAWDTITNN